MEVLDDPHEDDLILGALMDNLLLLQTMTSLGGILEQNATLAHTEMVQLFVAAEVTFLWRRLWLAKSS